MMKQALRSELRAILRAGRSAGVGPRVWIRSVVLEALGITPS